MFKVKLGFILFFAGFLGILSLLTVSFPLDNMPEEVLAMFSEQALIILMLINPTLYLIIAIIVGVLLYKKVDLEVPLIEGFIRGRNSREKISDVLTISIKWGILSGIMLLLFEISISGYIPELSEVNESFVPTPISRILYGGITEEIIMRFGVMTFFVWVFYKLLKNRGPIIYWSGIIFSSLIFALSHLPILFQVLDQPTVSIVIYILIGNSIGGIIFGWLYWRKGLEASFISHIFAHVFILMVMSLRQLI